MIAAVQPGPQGGASKEQGPTIKWDDSQMKSGYANVCNVTSTREEVVLHG